MRAHPIISPIPLLDASCMQTVCGLELYPAKIVYLWDTMELGPISLSTILFCKDCCERFEVKRLNSAESGREYIYGAVKGKLLPAGPAKIAEHMAMRNRGEV